MLFKKTLAGIAALVTIASMSGFTALAAEDSDKETGFKTGSINTLVRSADNAGTIDCRYYDALPNVPYVKLSDFYKLWADQDLEILNNDGIYSIKVPIGTTGTIDVEKDTISTDDAEYFFVPESEANATDPYSDIYIKEVPKEHEAFGVDINLSNYNIDIIGDGDDIWFPVATLCDTFVSGLSVPFYMEDTLYFGNELLSPFSITSYSLTEEHGNAVGTQFIEGRPQDLVDFNYNELCYSFDMTYGFPGSAVFNDLLKEKGLDGMLSEGNETTKKLKEMLHSTDIAEYTLAFDALNLYLWDGGHTQFSAITTSNEKVLEKLQQIAPTLDLTFEDAIDINADNADTAASGNAAYEARYTMASTADVCEQLNGALYMEKDDTAVFSFDMFNSDMAAWDKYYHDNGELPSETVSDFYNCVVRADKNPAIKKFVIDMGTNSGGLSLVATYMMALITDMDTLTYKDNFRDILISENFLIDRNFDKVIDEKDDNFKTDLQFGVLTSKYSFSCGNWLPSLAHDNGMVVIGETSGGGSCAIQVRLTADGLPYILSSGACLVDKDGNSIDLGIKPDFENVKINEDGTKDFSETYNFNNISKAFDEFYGNSTSNGSSTTTTTTATTTTATTTTTTSVTTESTTSSSAVTSDTTTEIVSTTTTTEKVPATTTTVVTTTEDKKYFTSLTEMGEMAAADYKSKNGTAPADSVSKDNGDGSVSIILSDDNGNVLDTYTINPVTGKGKDSKGGDVDLPQTGNNSVKTVAAVATAAALMTVGAGAVYVSGIGRKKKDNE